MAKRSAVTRGGLTGAGTAFASARLTTSGGWNTGTIRSTSPTIPGTLPGTPSGAPLGTAPVTPVPLPVASGGSSMMILAIGGTLAGAMRMPMRTCVAAAWGDRGTILGPGGGGGGGAPGVTSVVTRNARPKVCGEIIGASSAQPIIIAWPVKPMAVAQTLLAGGP